MQQKIIRILAFASLALFIFVLIKAGPSHIWQNLKKLSWEKLAILVLLRLAYWLLRTMNWRLIMNKLKCDLPFLHLFGARLAGHAVGYLTPSAKIGGEAARVLMADRAGKKAVLASVTIDKTIELLAAILLVCVGVVLAIIRIAMPGVQKAVLMTLAVLISALVLFLFNKQKKSFFIWLADVLKKMRIKIPFIEKNREKIKVTDAYISNFYSDHKKTFFLVFVMYVLLVLFWTYEIYLTFHFVGAEQASYLDCFLIVTLGTFSLVLPVIPASIGIYEITFISLVTLVGIKIEYGMALVLLRRTFGLLLAGVGIIPILIKGRFQDFVSRP
jgi:uncharacterized protein (TIRG00374 family)